MNSIIWNGISIGWISEDVVLKLGNGLSVDLKATVESIAHGEKLELYCTKCSYSK